MAVVWLVLIYSISLYAAQGQSIKQLTACYGDNSNNLNRINASCETGVIYLDDILTGSKFVSLGCPSDDHNQSPADQAVCCAHDSNDCIQSYTGDRTEFLKCNGLSSCNRPVVRMLTNQTCMGEYPMLTHYMTFQFFCVADGHINGACNTTDDCLDANANCPDIVCLCNNGYTVFDNICWEDNELNGSCVATADCHDGNAVCTDGRCVCDDSYTNVNSVCKEDGGNGGVCKPGSVCTDGNAVCSTTGGSLCGGLVCDPGVCECKATYSIVTAGGSCIKDGSVGGKCLDNNACTDTNAECNGLGICECSSGHSLVNSICMEDGGNGGVCEPGSVCTDDNAVCNTSSGSQCGNSVCDPGVCECKATYSVVTTGGPCIKDGDIGGKCSQTSDCHDPNALCSNAVCECIDGYGEHNGECFKDGHINGACTTDGDCVDDNAQCITNICQCNTDYTVFDDVCWKDKELNGACPAATDCSHDNAVCTDGRCICVSGYTYINGVCKLDGDLGGRCSQTSDCHETNAVCDSSFVCVCTDGYGEHNGSCFQDGHINGACITNGDCVDGNAQCITNKCQCNTGYTAFDDVCWKDRELNGSCADATECIYDNAVCTDDRCVCVSGYTIIGGVCKKDGSVGGACLENDACTDTNAECNAQGICQCRSGHSHVNSVCMEDGRLGGQCDTNNDCVDANTECSHTDDVCQCISGFSEVDGICKEDGGNGGVCKLGSVCTDGNALCATSSGTQCGNSVCDPGVCECKPTYSVVTVGGSCVKDGDIGGKCARDNDCRDPNANCDSSLLCVCANGYRAENGECIEDGRADGNCILPGNTCIDSHAICTDGVCRCNDFRDYVKISRTCQRKENAINGECNDQQGCSDAHAGCKSNVCVCLEGYNEVNGVCSDENSQSVTSCDGTSTHNTLEPDCRTGDMAIILDEFTMVKLRNTLCPQNMDIYNDTVFWDCCTQSDTDCRVYTDVTTDCEPPNAYLDTSNYRVKEYICVRNDTVIDIDSDVGVDGNPAYITSPDYPGDDSTPGKTELKCSVQASCDTNILVYVIKAQLKERNGICTQEINIVDDSVTKNVTCQDNILNSHDLIHTSSNGFITVTLTTSNPSFKGQFALKFNASDTQGSLNVSCGNTFQATSNNPLPQCKDSTAGRLGEHCDAVSGCLDHHAKCVDGTCVCDHGYKEKDDKCTQDDDPLLAIFISLGLLALILIVLAILLCCCRERIANKFCHKEEKADLVPVVTPVVAPIVAEPTPMNMRFAGKLPSDAAVLEPSHKRTIRRQMSMTQYILQEQTLDENKKKNLKKINSFHHNNLLKGEDGVVNTRFRRNMNAIHPEEIGMKHGTLPALVDTHANENKSKQKKKRQKRLRKAKIGLMAKQAFELPRNAVGGKEGTYRRVDGAFQNQPFEANAHHNMPQTHHLPLQPFSQSPQPPPMPFVRRDSAMHIHPGVQPGAPFMPQHAAMPPPPFRRQGSGYLQPGGHQPPSGYVLGLSSQGQDPEFTHPPPKQSFDSRAAWRKAGIVSSVATRPQALRRKATLDIASMDDPASIESSVLN